METQKTVNHADPKLEDDLPSLNPLCDLQNSVAFAYAEILSFVTQKLAQSSDDHTDGFRVVLDRLRHDAPWAVTEIYRGVDFKIRRQRYISQNVYAHWENLQRNGDKRKSSMIKDSKGITLRHEHVFERKKISTNIENLNKSDDIFAVLSKAVACIVTIDEDERLNRDKFAEGWERYRNAKIGVYDRLKRRWEVKRS